MFLPQSKLGQDMQAKMPAGMNLPTALDRLFLWTEAQGFYWEQNGHKGAALSPYGSRVTSAPSIEFGAGDPDNFKYWFGSENPEIKARLFVFAQTGGDGSMGAIWIDDEGQQKIVHMGSGSGSVMVCILADDPVDFLRLLAIGYEEICWGGFQSSPPQDEDALPPNTCFQDWVKSEFTVTIPKNGSEIVPQEPGMHDTDKSDDAFLHWTSKMSEH